LFAAGVIASSFSLFLVQPLIAKQILPWFGGTAAVWAVCMVFYQAALLAGYLYAHALARLRSARWQAAIHSAVVGASLLALPAGLPGGAEVKAAAGYPGPAIVWLLLRSIGVPYIVLSSTSPLMQAWHARSSPGGGAYKLFGWSNLSCAMALLSFPFLLEPHLELGRLNAWWSWGYAGVVCLLCCAALLLARRNPAPAPTSEARDSAPAWGERLRWLFFSALGSVVLVSVTNHLCQTVAPIPFLWTVPLLLYLLTFFVCFEREWYSRRIGMPLAGGAILTMCWALVYLPAGDMLAAGIPIFAAGCFLVCFYCHGELARRKPAPAHLTSFYLTLAAGGVLGSLLVAFGAPAVSDTYVELPVSLALCALSIVFSVLGRGLPAEVPAVTCAILAAVPALAGFMTPGGVLAAGRNFYGSLSVVDKPAAGREPALRRMIHGAISHGAQLLDPARAATPTAYYGQKSAPGLWFGRTDGVRRVGVVGLGAGVLATYGRTGDFLRFYEINPIVADFAGRHFTFLRDSAARVEVAIGDGRLLLAGEPQRNYDLLVVDAFSGDSIPVHLLTREAFQIYRRHLAPGGLLALHISNMFLDLRPVVAALASDAGWSSLAVSDQGDERVAQSPSQWVVAGPVDNIARVFGPPPSAPVRQTTHVWTDGYSTLLGALK
jgi:hypothetical protein